MLVGLWRYLKVWRRVTLGPVAFLYRLDRAVSITRGTRLPRARLVAAPLMDGVSVEQADAEAQVEPVARACRRPLALVVGVGPGFGYALARHLASEGFDLVLVCRDARRLSPLLVELHVLGASVEAYGADATDETDVRRLFQHVRTTVSSPALVVYSLQYFSPGSVVNVEVPAFEAAWRHNCLGAFLVGKSAATLMKATGDGTIIFVGSTSSLTGRAEHLSLAVGKFGQRALAQVMARELWPHGIHVAHVIIDADVSEDGSVHPNASQSDPDHIAHSILSIHRQPRTAWTSEMDLRPWNEGFWEHC